MKKELPKMYTNKINKTINSIQKVYSSINKPTIEEPVNAKRFSTVSINKKIEDIFNSYDYVYKADVTIVTDIDTIKKRIVARDNNNLITIDNEYIPIATIRDIYK